MAKKVVFTDGSCLAPGNEGTGPIGWAWAEVPESAFKNGSEFEIANILPTRFETDGELKGTNNIAELTAILKALENFAPNSKTPAKELIINSDSNYAINSVSVWIKKWKENNWKGSNRKTIANLELIQEIDSEIQKRETYGGTTEFNWVKAHAGDFYNEFVDDLARETALKYQEKAKNSALDELM